MSGNNHSWENTEDLADKKKLDTFTPKLLSKVQFTLTTPLLRKRSLSHRSWVNTKVKQQGSSSFLICGNGIINLLCGTTF